jgi:hypothetical protein
MRHDDRVQNIVLSERAQRELLVAGAILYEQDYVLIHSA